jgi:hypothetical protein
VRLGKGAALTTLLFLAGELSVVAFGLPAAFHPLCRPFPWFARLAAAFLFGAVALSVEAIVFSLIGVEWSTATIGVPLVFFSAVATSILRARDFGAEPAPDEDARGSGAVLVVASLVIALAFAHLAFATLAARATSADYLLFWGVKGVRFANARGIDVSFLTLPLAIHAHTNYPPLVPIQYAWGAIGAGSFPWRGGLLTMPIWFAATASLLYGIMRVRLTRKRAVCAVALWSVLLASSLVVSYSAGSAEPELLAFETIAVAAVVFPRDRAGWLIAGVALGGAMLSKNDAAIGGSVLVAGALAAELIARRRISAADLASLIVVPLALFSTWPLFECFRRVPMIDVGRETFATFSFRFVGQIAKALAENLAVGTSGISWIVLLILIAVGWKRWPLFLPAMAFAVAVVTLFAAYYLLHPGDPTVWIRNSYPRLIQPALSALVIAATLALLGNSGDEALEQRGAG